MSDSECYKQYISSSAFYCEGLFSLISLFFHANSAIENIIAEYRKPTQDEIDRIPLLFFQCGRSAVGRLRAYRDIHCSYPATLLSVDFVAQERRICEILSYARDISFKIGGLLPGRDLQDQIWQDGEITEKFVECARLISSALDWQYAFAEKTPGIKS